MILAGDFNFTSDWRKDRAWVLATTGHSTNFLMMIKCLTLTVAQEHWVLRGEALQMQRLYKRLAFLAAHEL